MKNNTRLWITIVSIIIIIIAFFAYYKVGQAPVNENKESSIEGCYVAKLSRDVYTIVIQSEKDGKVTGMIAYNNFEKDSSSGSFEGIFNNNILTGNYSFDSEGSRSDSQLIFKKVGDSFVQGFGPVEVINGKETFDPISSVVYDPKSTFVRSENCMEKFVDSNDVFSFEYNPYFKLNSSYSTPVMDWRLNAKQGGILLARVSIPRTYMSNTNFSNANLTVGRSTDRTAINTCSTIDSNGEVNGGDKVIDGKDFTKFTSNGAGAGNFYETTSYRGIVDGDCYVIEYTIHSTNIGNYSPDQGIKEFNKAKIQSDLEAIISSFQFQIQSS